ncbi:sugar phosphate isomerase/epimerase family protein [Mycobacterium camsae]|uniref:sugar phosphate isomerase/epimerase family protein n=1 Tax=Mycobacterium gordonae TaxID=1778 RepID=UPI0019814C2F|nr:sugar phosphate isomerase/epimerase family protein [Mycobacterium gordonae]
MELNLKRGKVIKLSYSTFGLTNIDFLQAITEVSEAGYDGVELAFHRDQFNPFNLTDDYVDAVKKRLSSVRTKAACVATASHFFSPSRPHEPSLMSPDLAGRKRRIDLIRRGIDLARRLDVPLVTFGSGFIRDEHLMNALPDPRELLVDSIRQCLNYVHDDEDITLLIEPEPGMFIETIDEGLSLIEDVGSDKFRLHVDMCHLYCSHQDYVGAMARAAPYARFVHVSDAQAGYNLKILKMAEGLHLDLAFANYLIYFPESADYLLVDPDHPMYFCDQPPSEVQTKKLQEILDSVGIKHQVSVVNYGNLDASDSPYDDEVFTYLISVPGLSYDVLERARPIILHLRTTKDAHGHLLMDKMVANTLTGIVHFHEIPGEGTMDFSAGFKTLVENGFTGYASVELYHHVTSWKKAMTDSHRHLSQWIQL